MVTVPKRKIIVNVATSADGYIARTDGNLDWLTNRPAPKGFYGLPKFSRSIDAKILGRKTFDFSVRMGASFSADNVHWRWHHGCLVCDRERSDFRRRNAVRPVVSVRKYIGWNYRGRRSVYVWHKRNPVETADLHHPPSDRRP
jgi:dihydrofolate reductase